MSQEAAEGDGESKVGTDSRPRIQKCPLVLSQDFARQGCWILRMTKGPRNSAEHMVFVLSNN